MKVPKKCVIDADNMIHIIAHRHWSAENQGDELSVRNNVTAFLQSIKLTSGSTEFLILCQGVGFENFRNGILPEYKAHRQKSKAVVLWKPIIIDQILKEGGVALKTIESDDALALLGNLYCHDVLMVCNDKDIYQIPGYHYNPFKSDEHMKGEPRFIHIGEKQATEFLVEQTITGDPTDMPGALCGIQRVGAAKARAAMVGLTDVQLYPQALKMYQEKYGFLEGLLRMSLTYNMVKLHTTPTDSYPETWDVLDFNFTPLEDKTAGIFDTPEASSPGSLF